MTERSDYFAGQSDQAIRDVKDNPLDPPKAPAISIPEAEGHHYPYDGQNDGKEALMIYAVLGLLGGATLAFMALMVLLNALNVL